MTRPECGPDVVRTEAPLSALLAPRRRIPGCRRGSARRRRGLRPPASHCARGTCSMPAPLPSRGRQMFAREPSCTGDGAVGLPDSVRPLAPASESARCRCSWRSRGVIFVEPTRMECIPGVVAAMLPLLGVRVPCQSRGARVRSDWYINTRQRAASGADSAKQAGSPRHTCPALTRRSRFSAMCLPRRTSRTGTTPLICSPRAPDAQLARRSCAADASIAQCRTETPRTTLESTVWVLATGDFLGPLASDPRCPCSSTERHTCVASPARRPDPNPRPSVAARQHPAPTPAPDGAPARGRAANGQNAWPLPAFSFPGPGGGCAPARTRVAAAEGAPCVVSGGVDGRRACAIALVHMTCFRRLMLGSGGAHPGEFSRSYCAAR
ncbi:hypothetical protein WOLCODRAFT_139636 [Wolfiporia cocos MD-104 SS10]|uniref:Uncharacterized protein n=1 Tax=Wolfiporia cocos (strain MD-104) TaxID=742152 RepID=A0A2H3JDW7_WOLCO|nr:hypothetical protein WOLCODRAFT_139636 [Wolfiporia cocos MD-104 SS10]